ncbi:winged helix-turn-helix domain-containing protein [Ekhidna sp.]|uniref:winged helix-turn-helix domain-containing protein n=1 Tax=Ekhidna sp. TaxID=2608089 RepID=UPI00329A4989
MRSNKQEVYQLGQWKIFSDRLMLQNEIEEIRIHDKNMRVLKALIDADGEVVTKEQFFETVWTDTIVTESSLNRAISELRKILDKGGSDQSLIETISKKGYRLTQKPIASGENNKSVIKWWKYAALLSVITISIFLLFKNEMNEKIAVHLSPNGNKVAYFLKNNSKYTLYIEDYSTKSVTLLEAGLNPESFAIAWSPRSDYVIFNATEKAKPFYAINIRSTEGESPIFVKFAKDDYKHQTQSIPEDLKSPMEYADYKEITMNNNKIHHVYLNEQDTIKVFFDDKVITSFGW